VKIQLARKAIPTSYTDVEEQDLDYGSWMRASLLPEVFAEVQRESSFGTCSKPLFPINSSTIPSHHASINFL